MTSNTAETIAKEQGKGRIWASFIIKNPGSFTSKLSSHYKDQEEIYNKLKDLQEEHPEATISILYDR